MIHLVFGLGNPGEKYINTRHNVGFDVIDAIFNAQYSISNQHSSFQFNKPLRSEIVEVKIGDEQVVLAKPQTFMNNSGLAVKRLVSSYQLSVISDLIIVHDDITLELGHVKISQNAGAGNHNGVQSIIDHVKTKDFIRVRCGIGRGDGVLSDVVLSKFKPDEKEITEKMIQKSVDACILIVKDGIEKTMNKYNVPRVTISPWMS